MKKKAIIIAAGILCLLCAACGGKTAEPDTAAETTAATTVAVSETIAETTETPVETEAETEAEIETVTEAPAETASPYTKDQLIIMQNSGMYTYDDMIADNTIINSLYSGYIHQDVIGTTADGRQILHYEIGNPDAEKEIFINAAIHAREYLTAQLVMKQMVTYLDHVKNHDTYGDISYDDMWNNCIVHVVPMVNPDGVTISQLGLDGIQNQSVRDGIYQIAAADGEEITTYYLDRWKANATGTDLNRNFDAYWENYEGPGHVSADHYKGEYPGSAPETAALIELTNSHNFSYTISYHTQGQLIYWCFADMDSIYDRAAHWVNQLSAATGYRLDSNYDVIDPAGYSDWGIYRCKIPSVTIEVASGESPYLADQFDQVWNENLTVWELTIAEAITYQVQ